MKAKLRSVLSIVMAVALILTLSMPAGTAYAGTTGIFSAVSADWSVDKMTLSLEMNVESDSEVEVVDAHVCPASNTEEAYYTDITCGVFEGEIRNSETSPREWKYEGTADISPLYFCGQGVYNVCVTLENARGQQTFMLSDFGMEDIDLGYDPERSGVDLKVGDKVNLYDPIYGAYGFRGDGKVVKSVVQDGAKVSFEFENAGIGYIYAYDRDTLELKNILSYEVVKKSAILKFDSERVTKSISDEPFTNTLLKDTDAEPVYSSSDTGVAVVDKETGEVTVKNAGSAVITAKTVETDKFEASEASYTVVVSKSVMDYSYAFKNFGLKAPLSTCKFMYGDNTVAKAVYDMNIGESGNCYGMSATSGLLCVKNDVSVSDFNSSKKKINELVQEDKSESLELSVLDFIQAMHITQVSAYMGATKIDNSVPEDMEKFISVLKEETAEGKPVMVCATSKGSGHAVLAYGINQVTPKRGVAEYQILLYDNNYPDQERIMTLEKWEDGVWSWNYEVAKRTYWGTYDTGGTLQYTTYDEYYKIWENRGNLTSSNKNLVRVSSENFKLYAYLDDDDDKDLVAEVDDGELKTEVKDVVDVTPVDITLDENGDAVEQTIESTVLSVPVDYYILENTEEKKERFNATIVNEELGVTVSAEADQISLCADDSEDNAFAKVDGESDQTFNITVQSSRLGDNSYVRYTGEGKSNIINYVNGNVPQTGEQVEEKGEINILDLSQDGIHVVLSQDEYIYDGTEKKPEVVVDDYGKVLDPSDYDVTYENNINAGTAAAVITGKGNCTGKAEAYFTIRPADISGAEVAVESQTYTGKAITPDAKASFNGMELAEGKDYDISYADNILAGTASAKLAGKGNYEGSFEKSFEISPLDISNAEVSGLKDKTYTGKALTQNVIVKVGNMTLAPSDCDVSYENNVDAGTATVVITGRGSCTGEARADFAIKPAKLTKLTFSYGTLYCTGKNRYPSVTAYAGEKECTSIKVTKPAKAKKPGTYKITVKGTGNYTGTLSKLYKMKVKGASIKSEKALKKGFKVTASKQTSARVTGYQFRYSRSKSMKNAKKTSLSKKNYRTVKKLKSKKTYYVQVRTYKTIDGKKYYSAWSSKKAVKTR